MLFKLSHGFLIRQNFGSIVYSPSQLQNLLCKCYNFSILMLVSLYSLTETIKSDSFRFFAIEFAAEFDEDAIFSRNCPLLVTCMILMLQLYEFIMTLSFINQIEVKIFQRKGLFKIVFILFQFITQQNRVQCLRTSILNILLQDFIISSSFLFSVFTSAIDFSIITDNLTAFSFGFALSSVNVMTISYICLYFCPFIGLNLNYSFLKDVKVRASLRSTNIEILSLSGSIQFFVCE